MSDGSNGAFARSQRILQDLSGSAIAIHPSAIDTHSAIDNKTGLARITIAIHPSAIDTHSAISAKRNFKGTAYTCKSYQQRNCAIEPSGNSLLKDDGLRHWVERSDLNLA